MITSIHQSVGFKPVQKTTRQRPVNNPLQRDTVQFSGKKPAIKFGMSVDAAVQANDGKALKAALAEIDDSEARQTQATSAYSNLLFNHEEPNPEAIQILLDEANVNVNEKNAAGDTALHTLSRKKQDNVPVWRLLMDRGIDVTEHDEEKRTAWHYVMQRPKLNPEIVAMLMHSRARIANHAQLDKALTTVGKRPALLEEALERGLNVDSNEHVVEVLFSKLKTRPTLMAKVLEGGLRLQPKDMPSKSMKDRLADPANLEVFERHLGKEKAPDYMQEVLDAAMTV